MSIRRFIGRCSGGLMALSLLATGAFAQQASLTLTGSDSALCYHNNTDWSLSKVGTYNEDTHVISWTVTATRGATSANTIQVSGVVTITNTGSAPATIGNIVVDLQRKSGAKWKAAAANVANSAYGDAATSANMLAAASESLTNAGVYSVSGAQGTFTETAGSGSLEFTDANSNTIFALSPEQTLAVGASVTLLYTANFNNSVLNIPVGSQVRVETIVTFGNSGRRGGSGATGTNIDISGDGVIDNTLLPQPGELGANDADEALVRSVPTRKSMNLPALEACNDSVTVSDLESELIVDGENVTIGNNQGFGSFVISATTTFNLTTDVTCTPPGFANIENFAHLDGQGDTISVQGQQIGTDPLTGLPIYAIYTFPCCIAENEDAGASVNVVCEGEDPVGWPDPGTFTTYTQGGYQGGGVPGQLLINNFTAVFPGGLTVGIADGAGPRHNASWTSVTALRTFLGGGGPSGALTADTLNATSVSGGTLTKQTVALALNVGFSNAAVLPAGFGAMYYHNASDSLDGMTVAQILGVANNALGGAGLPAGYTFGSLNTLITNLNESCDNGTVVTAWALAHLSPNP